MVSPRSIARVAAVMALAACQDNEQRARQLGARARDAVAKRCAGDAEAERDACTDARCREACSATDVPRGFTPACLDTCRQSGVCATDADCGRGSTCVAIAPVVRRCQVTAVPSAGSGL